MHCTAFFNLALLLQRNNKHEEAAEYWRRYQPMTLNVNGQHQRLVFCEIQMHSSAAFVAAREHPRGPTLTGPCVRISGGGRSLCT
jgi:hypothetical protein